MPALPYDYAVVRVVPRVERGEFVNAGVVVYCPTASTLLVRTRLDPKRLVAMDAEANVEAIGQHLTAMQRIGDGDVSAGPVAALPLGERFHWLVHPRSAVLQVSEVHAGMGDDLPAEVERLFARLVGA